MVKRVVVLALVIFSSFLIVFSASKTIAQDYCEGNFDNDTDVDGTDAAVFKTDFGRSAFKSPCPPNPPAPVEKTGQKTGYYNGDDGVRERGVRWPDPRFTDNENGTITDNLTGLIWLKDANCFEDKTWSDALDTCQLLTAGYCGLTDGSTVGDWRLPNIKELHSLVDFGNLDPALPTGHPFANVQQNYWSCTTYRYLINHAWGVNWYTGDLDWEFKLYTRYVWPVRGGY